MTSYTSYEVAIPNSLEGLQWKRLILCHFLEAIHVIASAVNVLFCDLNLYLYICILQIHEHAFMCELKINSITLQQSSWKLGISIKITLKHMYR